MKLIACNWNWQDCREVEEKIFCNHFPTCVLVQLLCLLRKFVYEGKIGSGKNNRGYPIIHGKVFWCSVKILYWFFWYFVAIWWKISGIDWALYLGKELWKLQAKIFTSQFSKHRKIGILLVKLFCLFFKGKCWEKKLRFI